MLLEAVDEAAATTMLHTEATLLSACLMLEEQCVLGYIQNRLLQLECCSAT